MGVAPLTSSQTGFDCLYYADSQNGTIGVWDPVSGTADVILSGLNTPLDVVVDDKRETLYWVSDGDNQIKQASTDGGPIAVLTSSPEPRGLALDADAGHLYFLDRTTAQILRYNLATGGTIVIRELGPGCFIPLTIVLDVENDLIYWTDPCQQTISRVNMDGGNYTILCTGQLNVRGLAIDFSSGKMYWVTFSGVYCANLDGSGKQQLVDLVSQGAVNPNLIALDLAAGKMYWTQQGFIKFANLDGTGTSIVLPVQAPSGLVLVTKVDESFCWLYYLDTDPSKNHASAWDPTNNSVTQVMGGLNVPIDLVVDPTRCKLYWISDGNNDIRRASVDGVFEKVLTSSPEPRGLALDDGAGLLFFMDRNLDAIFSYDLETEVVKQVHSTGPGIPLTLVLDVSAQQIYWSDASQQKISRVDYDGGNPTPIVAGQPNLRGIALDIPNDKIYWVTQSAQAGIFCASISGSAPQLLVDLAALGAINPSLIAIDRIKQKMYWTQASAIRRADLDGLNDEDVVITPKPSGLQLVDELTPPPWTDLGGGTLGAFGQPQLMGFGDLTAAAPTTIRLTNAPPGALMLAWVSLDSVPIMALGGVVHALPAAAEFLLVAPPSGEWASTFPWPAGIPLCTPTWYQFVVQDPSTPPSLVLSNGLLGIAH